MDLAEVKSMLEELRGFFFILDIDSLAARLISNDKLAILCVVCKIDDLLSNMCVFDPEGKSDFISRNAEKLILIRNKLMTLIAEYR